MSLNHPGGQNSICGGAGRPLLSDAGQDVPIRRPEIFLAGRAGIPCATAFLRQQLRADGIDFFQMDALSSAVALKVNGDRQLTLMASSLDRLQAVRVGHGYESARSRHLFRAPIDATAEVSITEKAHIVRF